MYFPCPALDEWIIYTFDLFMLKEKVAEKIEEKRLMIEWHNSAGVKVH